MSQYDVVVIGAGLAGLTAACQLAQVDKKVLVVAQGAGALLLAPGTIDVLGFQPIDSLTPVQSPSEQLPFFLADQPDHPYQLLRESDIKTGLEMFKKLVYGPLDYQGNVNRNWILPSAAGALRPTCLAPVAMANGDVSQRGRMLLVGFSELRDYYPSLVSQNLNAQRLGVQTAALSVNAPKPLSGKLNITPIELAAAFDRSEFRRRVVKAVKNKSRGYGRIGFPAVLGVEKHTEAVQDLQRQLGKLVFEINTLPPSVPGRRLFDALKAAFLQAGGRLIIGGKVVDGTLEDGRVKQIRIETASRLKPVTAENYVLGTGGIFGGGFQTDESGKVWESIFGLPVVAHSDRHQWYSSNFLDSEGQPVANYGIQVNQKFNPLGDDNTVMAENLFVAGASLAGSNWVAGRTGSGVAVASAMKIARQLTRQK
jgi:glycerol-3-phosphate dehydrogenase subunit B